MAPTIRIGTQAKPKKTGPTGIIHNLSATDARKMTTKNNRTFPGQLLLLLNM